MTEHLPRILDDRPLNGTIPVQRDLLPPLETLVVLDGSQAREAVSYCCEVWAGAAQLLIPASYSSSPESSPWRRVLSELDSDHFRGFGVASETLPQRTKAWAGFSTPLIVALASLVRDAHNKPRVSVPELDDADPWKLAYTALCGTLPEAPSQSLVERAFLRDDLSYSDVLSIERPSIEGSVEDLWSRVTDRSTASPTAMTLVGLQTGAPPSPLYLDAPLLPSEVRPGSRFGPGTIVVYEPGSVEDLCLIWCLRAAWGWPYGMPLAIPRSVDVVAAVQASERLGAAAGALGPPGLSSRAVVSTSVPAGELAEIAQQLGADWAVASVDDVLAVAQRPRRSSIEITAFDNGSAPVFAWSERDVSELGDHYSLRGFDTVVRFRPLTMQLPQARSLVGDPMMNGTWRGGSFETPGTDLTRVHTMRWPVGWTVLEAVARDRGYVVRRSRPGQAAEALLQRIGSLDELPLLSDPAILKTLYRLGERSGITFFRREVNEILRDLRSLETAQERIDALEAHLDSLNASGDDADLHTITPSSLSSFGAGKEVRAWLEWAETAGVLLRGTEVSCRRCGHKQWTTLAELAPPILCRGCMALVEVPYRADNLHFSFRASETLLRTLEHDSLGHLLTLGWMSELFHRGFNQPETLYGGHPGVEVLRPNGDVVGEVDVLLLFSDGSIAVGEYKRSGAGLNTDELAKLDRVADALGAEWTFVATHDLAEDCPELWHDCQLSLPDRPRFALTGDRLYAHAVWTMGTNPFEWPSESIDRVERGSVIGIARSQAETRIPDSSLHRYWQWLDSGNSTT